jgi:integrase
LGPAFQNLTATGFRGLVGHGRNCGLRWGEAVAIRIRDVEFLRWRLNVHENAVQLGVEHAVGAPKSRKPRSVPVADVVLAAIAPPCAGKTEQSLVFSAPDGGYLSRPKSSGG